MDALIKIMKRTLDIAVFIIFFLKINETLLKGQDVKRLKIQHLSQHNHSKLKNKYPAKPDTTDKNLHKQVGAAQRFHAPNFRLKPGGLQSAAGEWAPEK